MPPSTEASQNIDHLIATTTDWRGEMLQRVRSILHRVDPEIVEEWKWRGTPVFSHAGIICTSEVYKSVVKMTFTKGASLPDPQHLFNSSLDGNVRRAIDLREGEQPNEAALTALIQAAVALNLAGRKPAKQPATKTTAKPAKTK